MPGAERIETPLNESDSDALAAEITTLWGHITAATHRFLELVGEFDRREGWVQHGLPSCAHWLNLNCGIGLVAAREKVRVAAALQELPKIDEAFAAGQVSYSKVRAITRVATPEMQETLLNIALHGTASHVERVVRDFRSVERSEEARLAEIRHRERYLRFHYDDDGAMRIYAKLPPEVGAVVRKAIEAAMAVVDDQPDPRHELHEDAGPENRQDVPSDLTVDDSAESPEPSKSPESPESPGSPGSPESQESLQSPESSEYSALDDPFGARRVDALRLLAEQFLASESERLPSTADRYQVVVHIDQRLLCDGRDCSGTEADDSALRVRGRCGIEDGPALAIETARRLGCDSTLVGIVDDANGEPLNVGRKTRAISPALKRALAARDGCCRFPGCDRTRFTEGHHVHHWADGGETKLSNLITLCRFHHRLIHEGGFGVRATDDGMFVFTDGAGQRLEPYRNETRRFRGIELAGLNAARGVTPIGPPGWHGEPLDRSLAIEGMLWEKERHLDSPLTLNR